MKNALVVCLGLLFLTSGATAVAKLKVFACEPEWKSLVETLGGETVKAYSATTAFQDPHYIEARPSLIAKVRTADLVVCTGAELEIGWLPLLLRQSGNSNIQKGEVGYFLSAEQVERIEVPDHLDRNQGDVHASGNPHVHWNPYKLITIAQKLSDRLIQIDPDNAQHYTHRFKNFKQTWDEKINEWETKVSHLKGRKVVVYHKNWSYLLHWLGIEVVGDIEPKPGIPPTSSHLASLLKTLRSKTVDFIMVANFQNEKGARWLHKKSEVPMLILPFTVGGSDKANDLISLYDQVIHSLVDISKDQVTQRGED